jgi:thymidylate synthase (FAD)
LTQVLDHGYVKEIESWGSDERIIEAARMSTGKGFKGWGNSEAPGDEKLLKYLYDHNHSSPFEMAGMIIEVQAPIFVFREWHRHRTQSYNEFSARYETLPNTFYVPSIDRLIASSRANVNKQVSGSKELNDQDAKIAQGILIEAFEKARYTYDILLASGVSKEVARIVIPTSQYSKMRASANLLNWIKFLKLRVPENAQWEIRQFADAVRNLLEGKFPQTMKLVEI